MENSTTRTCTKCGETKPLEAFHRRTRNTQGREAHCKTCHTKKGREWRLRNPEKYKATKRAFRERHRERLAAEYRFAQYGITAEEWAALFEGQGRACAICRAETPGVKTVWQTDHCHTTGKVRGILCRNCNVALGLLQDSSEIALAAHAYLTP